MTPEEWDEILFEQRVQSVYANFKLDRPESPMTLDRVREILREKHQEAPRAAD